MALLRVLWIWCLFLVQCQWVGVFPEAPSHPCKAFYIDSGFSDSQEEIIRESISKWQQATHNWLEVKYLANFPKTQIPGCKVNVIIKTDSRHEEVRRLDQVLGSNVLGYYRNFSSEFETIFIVIDRQPDFLHRVAMHELGHSLGLPHNKSISIMNSDMFYLVHTITPTDLNNLRKAWNYDGTQY